MTFRPGATLTLSAPRVLTGTDDLSPGWVQVDGRTIVAVGTGVPPVPADIALTDGVLAPGLVDAQVNGAFGVDLADANETGWIRVAQGLPTTGVTAFVPTFITAPFADLVRSLRRYWSLRPRLDSLPGAARTFGAHLEGPFLAERRRGAHRVEYLIDPSPEAIDAIIAAGRDGALLYLTLAPEREGGIDAVHALRAAGVLVSIGHSDAREYAVHAAADAGATLVTHLFNAQPTLHHRDPGVVGAALVDDRLTCGLIVDGHHVLPPAIRIAFASAPGRIMLVTDAVAAFGMPVGTYVLGGQEITVRADAPPRRADGTIAGATGRLDDAIALTVAAGVPLRTAVEAATRIPADALELDDAGRLAPGRTADVVWLAPTRERPLRARATWVAGELAFTDSPETLSATQLHPFRR